MSVPYDPTEDNAEPVSYCQRVKSIVGDCCDERGERLLSLLGLSESDLSDEECEMVKRFLCANSDVFALDDSELGCTDLVQHKIDCGDHPPIKQHFRRVPFVYREKISSMIDLMLSQGIIRPSTSPWASPVVLVPKKDGQLRFCVDYRRLNAVTKKDQYPLPRIDDILDMLGKKRYFSTLDLASGYW